MNYPSTHLVLVVPRPAPRIPIGRSRHEEGNERLTIEDVRNDAAKKEDRLGVGLAGDGKDGKLGRNQLNGRAPIFNTTIAVGFP